MTDFVIRPGDTVVCVNDRLPDPPHPLQLACRDRVEEGATYQVSYVVWLYGEKGLHLAGKNHSPTDGWRAARFRKVLETKLERTFAAPKPAKVAPNAVIA